MICFCFHKNAQTRTAVVFIHIAWNLQTSLGRIDIFTILNLQNHEHGMSLIFYGKFSSNHILKFSKYRSCLFFSLFLNILFGCSVNHTLNFFPLLKVYFQCYEIQEIFSDQPSSFQLIVDGRNVSEDSFGLFLHTVTTSVNKMFSLFLYLSFSSVMLNRGGDSSHFVLSLISAGSFQHFTVKYDERQSYL